MHAAAVFVHAIIGEAVVGNRYQRPQIRQGRPQAVVGADMRSLQLAGPGGPEAFARIVQIPDIEVADLWSLDGHDTEYVARGYAPSASGTDRDDEALDESARVLALRDALIEGLIHRQADPLET